MAAGRYDFKIEQGATFTRQATWSDENGVPINLTGYTISGKIRKKYSDSNEIATFTCELVTPLSGIFSFSLTATQTASIVSSNEIVGVYDIKATIGSTVYRILEGEVRISPDASR